MRGQNSIDIVVEELNKYPDIKFDKKNDSELEIFCRDDKGFDKRDYLPEYFYFQFDL